MVSIFDKKWWRLSRKVNAYRSLEGAHGWPIVAADLAEFCYWKKSTNKVSPVTITTDPLAMAQAEGRREVFLRIMEMMDTNDIKIRSWMHDEMMQAERAEDETERFGQ